MLDQAATLRKMVFPRHSSGVESSPVSSPRVIAVTSGKGGVGKTNLTVNMAIALAQLGQRVTVFDADLGLANIDVLLGLRPLFNLGDVLLGQRALSDVVLEGPSGILVLPGSSGLEELTELTPSQRAALAHTLREFEASNDYILIDTPAGIGTNVTSILRAAGEILFITTPEPTAVIDVYATIKVAARHAPTQRFQLLINEVQHARDAQQIYDQLASVAYRFLDRELEYLGMIVRDESVPRAVKQQAPFIKAFPEAPASRCLRVIAKQLHSPGKKPVTERGTGSPSFWGRLFGWGE